MFFNDGNYVQLETRESDKLFDNVPLRSKSQEIAANRIDDGLITEGYDAVPIDMQLPLSFVPVESNTNSFFPARSYLKSGGIYKFGIVYYDHANRSGTANIRSGKSTELIKPTINIYGTTLYVPFLTDPAYTVPFVTSDLYMGYVPEVSPLIYNAPPSWATHYQLVRSKNESMDRYIQFVNQEAEYLQLNAANNYIPSPAASAEYVRINLTNITGRYLKENPNSRLVYDYATGDRIRFIADVDATPPAYTTIQPFYAFNDSEVISYDPATSLLMVRMGSTTPQTLPMTGGTLF